MRGWIYGRLERVKQFRYFETNLTNQILFRKKLRTDSSHGMLAIIRCRISFLPVFHSKFLRLRYLSVFPVL
jgi:hypothetical protein